MRVATPRLVDCRQFGIAAIGPYSDDVKAPNAGYMVLGRICSSAIVGASLVSALGGCTPSLSITPLIPTAPTIAELQNHVTCVLATSLDNHLRKRPPADAADAKRWSEDAKLWMNLVNYNFVGSMVFTVFVNQSEGLNPSFSFITPLTNLGNPILKTIESSNGLTNVGNGTGTSNANNFTLSVGFQLNGSQDRNFVFNYLADFGGMYADLDRILNKCASKALDLPGGLPYGLKGDLALDEALETGLRALNEVRYYPIASQGGVKSNSQGSSGQGTAQNVGATAAFSAKIDFNLLWGVNGGPNWTLLSFKGPGGGGGGAGGGGSSSAGGSGSSGGGGGAGGQLVNFNRSKTDTLIATFNATCKTDSPEDLELSSSGTSTAAAVTKGNVSEVVNGSLKGFPGSDIRVYLSGSLPKDGPASLTGAILATGPVQQSGLRPRGFGNITWAGYVDGEAPTPVLSIRGTVIDALSGSFVGYVILQGRVSQKGSATFVVIDKLRINPGVVSALLAQPPLPGTAQVQSVPTYWDSISSCALSRPVSPSGLTLLQQLSPDLGATLLQQ